MTGPQQRRVGSWALTERLGKGGNGEVWRARRSGHADEVALKIINATNANREPYQRFVREISVLQEIGSAPGVLPVIDSYLPDAPSSDDRPWLAMRIARPLAEALAGQPLARTVEACSAIADTLASLAQHHGLAHRDIKPSNLYGLDDDWLVGDFGLVAVPNVEELTRSGRPLGPAHYLAYEMLLDPARADAHKADVYSLAKTIWVLACQQNYPPQGHQRADARMFTIAEMHPHGHAASLDRLVDRMTRVRADERPTMAEVAKELRRWLELPMTTRTLDVSAARARLQGKLSSELAAQDLLERRRDNAHAAARRLQELFKPLGQALTDLYPRAELNVMDDKPTQNTLRSHRYGGEPGIAWRWQRCSRVVVGPEHNEYALKTARCLELDAAGILVLHLLVEVGGRYGSDDFRWQPEPGTAPVGTMQAERMLSDGVNELANALAEGIDVFVEQAPGASD